MLSAAHATQPGLEGHIDSLAPTARAVRLTVSLQQAPLHGGRPPAMRQLYTVTVPLTLSALRRRRRIDLTGTVTKRGVRDSLAHLYLWPIGDYQEAQISGPSGMAAPAVPRAYLNGREIQSLGDLGDRTGGTYSPAWTLPPLRHGARATLSIPLIDLGPGQQRVAGPWRITFTAP